MEGGVKDTSQLKRGGNIGEYSFEAIGTES